MSVKYVFNFLSEDFVGKFDGQPVSLKTKEGRYLPAGAAKVIADQLIDAAIMANPSLHSRVHDASFREREYFPRVFTKQDKNYKDELEKAVDLGLTNALPETVSTADIPEPVVPDYTPEPEEVETVIPATPKRKPGRPPKVPNEIL